MLHGMPAQIAIVGKVCSGRSRQVKRYTIAEAEYSALLSQAFLNPSALLLGRTTLKSNGITMLTDCLFARCGLRRRG